MTGASVKFSIPILFCVLALPVIAGEGRIPVWQYPTVISSPGKYIVTRDIRGSGAPVIDIKATQVDLDINGFTLEEQSGGFPVIQISGNVVDVVIRNGILVGGRESIDRGAATSQAGDRVVIEDVQSFNAGASAIHLWTINEVVIRRVNILWPVAHGIHLDRTGGFTNGMIDHCAIRMPANSWDGIHVDRGSSFAIRHNRIETPSLHGIHVANSVAVLVGENTISDADGNGIFFEATIGGKIYNNVVSRGETNGIFIDAGSSDNLLLDNLVRQSGWGGAPAPGSGGGHGILIDGFRNHLEGNTSNENDACGILFNGSANTYGRNMARGNDPSGSFCFPATCAFGLFPPDSCDNGPGNDTYGDNLIPGPPPF